MSSVHTRAALVALACMLSFVVPARAEVVVEVVGSEPQVCLTTALKAYGMELQVAHELALLATEGVMLEEIEETCTAYMVTMFWCDTSSGEVVQKFMRFRMDANCFSSYFPNGEVCAELACPPGFKPLHRQRTAPEAPLGLPSGSCVWLEITGPVESTCGMFVDCDVLPDLGTAACDDSLECVEVVPIGGNKPVEMPVDCPACQ